jgi:predicted GNAT family acetyltransferase
MSDERESIAVKDNPDESRYEADVDGDLAVVEYRLDGDQIAFLHTEVPESMEGKGVGSRLARAVLDDAKSRQLEVVPLCPFIASYIRRHQEYLPLVAPAYREGVTRR